MSAGYQPDSRGILRGMCTNCTQCNMFENNGDVTCAYCGCVPVAHAQHVYRSNNYFPPPPLIYNEELNGKKESNDQHHKTTKSSGPSRDSEREEYNGHRDERKEKGKRKHSDDESESSKTSKNKVHKEQKKEEKQEYHVLITANGKSVSFPTREQNNPMSKLKEPNK